jgi:hypothetical protein
MSVGLNLLSGRCVFFFQEPDLSTGQETSFDSHAGSQGVEGGCQVPALNATSCRAGIAGLARFKHLQRSSLCNLLRSNLTNFKTTFLLTTYLPMEAVYPHPIHKLVPSHTRAHS